uniref:Alpha-1,3/1,6-mannosyltransferase ALG2 n=1 Tax=Globodera pallida TaxID=36090 RepID=A0A183CIA4_GLOPA
MLVVIVHPEQWNGGSDRCTIGLLRHFVQAGHKVIWLTTMIDTYWASENFHGVEIVGPSFFANLSLHPGDWYTQNTALALYYLCCKRGLASPDLMVVDHSASCIPLFKWFFPRCHFLFYCHFPQQLVTPSRFFLYRWYAYLMGLVEGQLFEYVDIVLVNSEFTGRQFRKVMPTVSEDKIRVVYPPCDVDSLRCAWARPISRAERPPNERYLFLSMNRFWPEKRLDIILEAAVELKRRGYRPRIQMAGSVMPHIPESSIYYQELQSHCKQLELDDLIEFLPDPTDERKFELYRQCDSVIYTPPNEHFGIVPIEALEQRRPVIVNDSGGPAETVLENITGTKIADTCGLLLADAMVLHIKRKEWPQLDRDELYKPQRLRFDKNFSWKGFGRRIDEAIAQMFSGQIAEQNSEMHRHQNGTVHLRMSENLQNGISDMDADLEDLEDLADLERGVGHGEHSQRNKLSNVPPPQANGGRQFLINSGMRFIDAIWRLRQKNMRRRQKRWTGKMHNLFIAAIAYIQYTHRYTFCAYRILY